MDSSVSDESLQVGEKARESSSEEERLSVSQRKIRSKGYLPTSFHISTTYILLIIIVSL